MCYMNQVDYKNVQSSVCEPLRCKYTLIFIRFHVIVDLFGYFFHVTGMEIK